MKHETPVCRGKSEPQRIARYRETTLAYKAPLNHRYCHKCRKRSPTMTGNWINFRFICTPCQGIA